MVNNSNIRRKERIIFSIIFILFLGALIWLFPYSGDDWAWGSSIGVERLGNLFRNYNGRYLGNILVMILTRFNILRVIVITLTLYGIVYLCFMHSINSNNKTYGLYISALLLVFIPKEIWMQSVVWTSGYSNYVISAFLILIYFIYIKKSFEKEAVDFNKKHSIPIFILGLTTTLFMEHITLYSVVLGIFIVVFNKIKFKRVYLVNISYLIGTILGTIIMFSNGAYRNIVAGNESYRSIPKSGGFIAESIDSFFNVIYKQLAFNNVILNLVLSAIVILLILKYNKNLINKKYIGYPIIFIISSYPIYCLISNMNSEWKILLKYTKYFEGIFSIMYYIALILFVLIFIEDRVKKSKLLFLLGSITILVGPLFIVNPIGPRCFFGTYMIFMLIVLELFDCIKIKESIGLPKVIISIIISVQFIYLFSIYGYIYKVNNERLNAVKIGIENKASTIVIPKLPYKKYVWTGDPFDFWTDRFKLFYGIDEETTVKTLELKEWAKNKK